MNNRLRTLGLLCAASAVIGVAVGFSDLLAKSGVPADQWSYPLSAAQLWVVSPLLAVDHVLQALGFVGIGVLRPYTASRLTDRTVRVAVWGFLLFAVAELGAPPSADSRRAVPRRPSSTWCSSSPR